MFQNQIALRVLLPIIAMAVNASTTSLAQQCVPPPANMIGWWPGDNNEDDISGSGNNGTLQNGATFASGKVGQAFSLDGVNDYILIPNTGGIYDFDQTESFSWDAWFRTAGSNNLQTILSKEDGSRPTFNIKSSTGWNAYLCSPAESRRNLLAAKYGFLWRRDVSSHRLHHEQSGPHTDNAY